MNLVLQVSGNSHCPQEGSCGGFKPNEEHATPQNQANQRILVIDDNPAIHSDLRRVLARSDAGELGFERNVGCGATFTIRLPISASETGGED